MGDTVEAAFRSEWPRLVATLVRQFGDLGLAEDCASEAFAEASLRWGDDPPERPGAWLLTTARRRGIDTMRRQDRYADKLRRIEATARSSAGARTEHNLIDDQLALILGCCHPALNRDAQVALTLRIVAGLSIGQVAAAFLVSESTMTRRLTRAKHKIRVANIPFRVPGASPDRAVLRDRLDAVLGVIYLIFTQGHASAEPAELVRGDLCDEALWLAELVTELVPTDSEAAGLLAMLLLTDARRSTRLDAHGGIVLLEDQDRSRWDRQRIDEGMAELRRAHEIGCLDRLGPFVLQAAAGAVHAAAPSFAATDWLAIVEIYDRMLADGAGPVVALNRAVARSYTDGPGVGLADLDAIGGLDDYHYRHSARAELLVRLDRGPEAEVEYEAALVKCGNEAERRFLVARLAACRA